VTEMLAM